MSLLNVEHLTKNRNGSAILEDVSFAMDKSSVICLTGNNYKAKKELFSILIGLNKYNSGKISIFDMDLHKYSPKINRRTGYMPNASGFEKNKTVNSILKYSARIKKASMEKADELCKLFEVNKKEFAQNLTDTEVRIVSFICSVLNEPELLMLDEPLQSLTAKQRSLLITILKRLNSSGTALICACHDISPYSEFNPDNYLIEDSHMVKISDDSAGSLEYFVQTNQNNKIESLVSDITNNDCDTFSSCEENEIMVEEVDSEPEQNIQASAEKQETIEYEYSNEDNSALANVTQEKNISVSGGKKYVQLSCSFISPAIFKKINVQEIKWYDNGVSFIYEGNPNNLILALLYCNITDIYICDAPQKNAQ